tara:strand:+ start:3334 stop:5220 length:1887 start_codon:yes stop_codon:yes gene_type:complete
MKYCTYLALCALSAATLQVQAAQLANTNDSDPMINHHALEEVIVTSSGIPMPLRRVGTSVSVVTAQEIERLGYNSLVDILRTQPGIGVSNQGGTGGVTSLRIRGEENYRTRFFLDGMDISDSSSPQTTARVEQLLSSGIARVEILRGPQGLIYGADAGGVVNITTAAPTEGVSGDVSAEGGRFGTRQFAGAVNGGNGTLDFSLSAADFETDGFNARKDDTDLRDDDGYDNTTLHGRFGWNATDKLRLSLVARDVESDHEYDGCFGADFNTSNDCADDFQQQAWRTGMNYTGDRFSHEVFFSDSEIKRNFYSDGQFSFKLDGEIERGGYVGSFDGSDALKFVYGLETINEYIDDGFLDTNRDQTGYFAEYQGGFADRFFVTAGTRYDENDDFGSHGTYRLSGAYLIPVDAGEIKLRATYGTGFRAPSLYEIATNASEFTGPPAQGFELSEEESKGYDVALSWLGEDGLHLALTYFEQSISDEIFYDFDSFGYLQKTGDTESTGIELSADWPVGPGLSLNGNYSYTDSQDINGEQRPRRAEHMANLGLNWSLLNDRLLLGAHARLSRDAIDVDGTVLDDYELLNLSARFAVLDGLELYGRVENATDEDYAEVPTYNTAGAAGYIGLKYAF